MSKLLLPHHLTRVERRSNARLREDARRREVEGSQDRGALLAAVPVVGLLVGMFLLAGCVPTTSPEKVDWIEAKSQECANKGMDTQLAVNKYGSVQAVYCTARAKQL